MREEIQFKIPVSFISLDSVCFFTPIQINISSVWWIISKYSQPAILTVWHIEFTWVGDIVKKFNVHSQKNQWNNRFYQVVLVQVKWSQKYIYNNIWNRQFLTAKSFFLSVSLKHTHTHVFCILQWTNYCFWVISILAEWVAKQ